MAKISQSNVKNRLLRALSAEDFDLLLLTSEDLALNQTLFWPGARIDHLYFIEHGFASITTGTSNGQVEVGMIGREGLVGASPALLGAATSPFHCYVQMSGQALSIATADLLGAARKSPVLQQLLLRYVQALMVQTAEAAFANAACTMQARLARWLLMCRDRGDSDELTITHGFLAIMLGVRRPGVTELIHVLEGRHLIKATRARINLLDRPGIEAAAGKAYGLAEVEYVRLIERHGDSEC